MDPQDKPTVEQLAHLFRLIGDGICTRTNFQAYLEKPNGLIVSKKDVVLSDLGTTLPLIVDCTRTLKQMIKAGCYAWANPDITADHLPITEKGSFNTEVVLLHYNKFMKTTDILADMESKGLKPGKIEHLLAVGEKYPNLQLDFPIVALGSFWQDSRGRNVPYLDRDDAKRDLSLGWSGGDWSGLYRFLAVRK